VSRRDELVKARDEAGHAYTKAGHARVEAGRARVEADRACDEADRVLVEGAWRNNWPHGWLEVHNNNKKRIIKQLVKAKAEGSA